MNKNKLLFIGLLSVLLVFGIIGCPNEEEAWSGGGGKPELTKLTIAGKAVGFGTPNENAAQAIAGSITLKSSATDSEGNPTYTVSSPTIIGTPSNYTIKYAVTINETPPNGYAAKPDSLKNNDYLWLQVSNKTTLYYVIKIEVVYAEIDVFAFKNHPVSREFTLDGWKAAGAAQTLTVDMEEGASGYLYQWYSNTVYSNKDGAAIDGATNADYTPVITTNETNYYYVTVTYKEETITSNVAIIKISDRIENAPTLFTIGNARRNYVRGVGGTGSFMFRTGGNADASPDADERYIDLLMGELGCNILRIMVQDDYTNYITNSIQSRNSATFYHNARDNFFPVIRKVNEYGGYVFANPWTAPGSMKSGGKEDGLAGGTLTTNGPNYVDYAEHLRSFLKWLNDNEAPIFALGILNEPDYGAGADYEGMGMSPEITRDWFRTVGNFTTQKVTNRAGASTTGSIFAEDIIPGYGGGGPTHHVLAMSGDSMGRIADYMDPQIESTGDRGANKYIELMGRHYYSFPDRYTKVVGSASGEWKNRPQLNYIGPYETESLAMSPQMYAPGSTAGSIKREVWQTEHDFNYHSNSTQPPLSNVQNYWNSAFAALNDVDWCLRVNGESVFDWWYSSSYSGLVTSYQTAGFAPYTITPRGRAFAHYARYVNETWMLPIARTKGTVDFNKTTAFNAGATDPKISAFEDVNGKFISIVMFTPNRSTSNGAISNSFGQGGTVGRDDPREGSINVGRIAVALPGGFIASSATAIRSYGNGNATGEAWDDVPTGTPRYWIDEPVFLSTNDEGQSIVEVTLPGGNVISIMVKGTWPGREVASPERKRPYTVR